MELVTQSRHVEYIYRKGAWKKTVNVVKHFEKFRMITNLFILTENLLTTKVDRFMQKIKMNNFF